MLERIYISGEKKKIRTVDTMNKSECKIEEWKKRMYGEAKKE